MTDLGSENDLPTLKTLGLYDTFFSNLNSAILFDIYCTMSALPLPTVSYFPIGTVSSVFKLNYCSTPSIFSSFLPSSKFITRVAHSFATLLNGGNFYHPL